MKPRGAALLLSLLGFQACHEVGVEEEPVQTFSPECQLGYVLSNVYLGEGFVLQASVNADAPVFVAPVNRADLRAAVWFFHPSTSEEFPTLIQSARDGRVLSASLYLYPAETAPLSEWRVVPLSEDPEIFRISPEENANRALDVGAAPPFDVSLPPLATNAGQRWRMAARSVCEEDG